MDIQILTKADLEAFKAEMLEAITEAFISHKKEKENDQYLRAKEVRQILGIFYSNRRWNLSLRKARFDQIY